MSGFSRKVLFDKMIDAVLPPRCVITGEIVPQQGMIDPKAFQDLDFISNPMCDLCGFPFDYVVDEGAQCTSCLDHPPPYNVHRSVFRYNAASRSLILGFKHADKTHVVSTFGPWLKRVGSDFLLQADFLVPVPLHYWRLVSRRYNQSALIAQALYKESGVPVLLDGLKRVKATPSQGHLKAKERFKNVKRAFAVSDQYKDSIQDKNIILIDDVYTTGATMRECAKTLLKAGAKSVQGLSLARVVRDEFDF